MLVEPGYQAAWSGDTSQELEARTGQPNQGWLAIGSTFPRLAIGWRRSHYQNYCCRCPTRLPLRTKTCLNAISLTNSMAIVEYEMELDKHSFQREFA